MRIRKLVHSPNMSWIIFEIIRGRSMCNVRPKADFLGFVLVHENSFVQILFQDHKTS